MKELLVDMKEDLLRSVKSALIFYRADCSTGKKNAKKLEISIATSEKQNDTIKTMTREFEKRDDIYKKSGNEFELYSWRNSLNIAEIEDINHCETTKKLS